MTTTDVIFAAFLQCETKAYLLREGVTGTRSEVGSLQQRLYNRYQQAAAEWLKLKIQKDEPYVERPSSRVRKQRSHVIVFEPLIESSELRAQPDAVYRTPSELSDQGVMRTPVRFVRTEKLSRADKLLLGFDALAIHQVTGRSPDDGKLIHGSQFHTVTVPLAKLLEIVESALTKLRTQQASRAAPPLVLNKHCLECEFRSRCREVAIEKDDLSLLANMTAKERQKLHGRGIFTVTQLSYTFRPRRHQAFGGSNVERHEPALKALAIRKDRIHVVGAPDFNLSVGTVYLDVEGVPDTGFYYLIGLRHRGVEGDVQHSFWADTLSDEHEIWASCLRTLKLIDGPRLVYYGSYETVFLKRMRERYEDLPEDKVFLDRLIASAVNILSLTYARIYFPTYSNGLKDIARHLGFGWSESEASGLNAIIWRSEWESTQDPNLKWKLITYNAEDCEAAQRVAEAVAGLCSEQPSAEALSVNVSTLERD